MPLDRRAAAGLVAMLLAAAVIVVTATTTAPPRDTSHNSLPADRGGRLPLAGTTSAPVAAFPARADQPDDPLAGFDDYAKAALADWRTPGMAIAIVKDGKAVLARGYGIRRVGENDPVDEQTVFPRCANYTFAAWEWRRRSSPAVSTGLTRCA